MLSAIEKGLLQQAADLLTDQKDQREQHARAIVLGVIADKEKDDRKAQAANIMAAKTGA